MKYFILVLFLLTSIYSYSYENKKTKVKKTLEIHSSQFCGASIDFLKKGEDKKQQIKLSEKAKLNIEQSVSTFKFYGAKVAANAMCQNLDGVNYTGSEQEWAAYLSNALNGIKKSGATDINLTLSAGADLMFPERGNVKEFIITASFDKNKQIILNYVYLNLKSNTVYSVSVSGAQKMQKYLKKEIIRLVNSITFIDKE